MSGGSISQWEGTALRAHPPQTDREFRLRAEQFSRYAAPIDITRVALRAGLFAGAFDIDLAPVIQLPGATNGASTRPSVLGMGVKPF